MPILGIIASKYVAPVANYKFFGVHDYGAVTASTDGISWDFKQSNDLKNTRGITKMNGGRLYVANNKLFMLAYTFALNVSTNGTTWNFYNNNGNPLGPNLLYAQSKYVSILGYVYGVGTSTDGITWVNRTIPSYAQPFYGLAYGNNTFVLTTGDSTLYSSTDAITWTSRSSGLTSSDYLVDIVYGDKFVAVGTAGGTAARIVTSTDGITWTSRTPATTWNGLYAVTYDSTVARYVAAGENPGAGNRSVAQYSTDGITWTNSTTKFATDITITGYNAYSSNNGTYVVMTGSDINFWSSTDGSTWTSRTPATSLSVVSAAYFDSKWYIAVDYSATNTSVLAHTTNFTTWTWVTSGPTTITPGFSSSQNRIIYVNNKYILHNTSENSDSKTFFFTSTDLVTWTTNNSPLSSNFNFINYGNGIYFIGRASAQLYTSTDLVTWTSRTANFGTSTIFTGAYGNSTYVIGGNNGQVSTSTDGTTWTSRTANFSTGSIFNIKYINNIFMAVGSSGRIATSTDGITWTSRTTGVTVALRTCSYGASTYIASGDSNTIIYSTDLVTWTTASNPGGITNNNTNWYSASFNNDIFLVSSTPAFTSNGPGNTYITSTDGITWTSRRNDKIYGQDSFLTNSII